MTKKLFTPTLVFTLSIIISPYNAQITQAKAEENIPEDDVISCYTLIQNYPLWQKEKIHDPIIKSAAPSLNCPNLPYKIYEGNAYNWKKPGTSRPQNLPYLCIKDLKIKNRYNLLLKTAKLSETLNNPYLGKNFCTRLSFLLSAPQWTTLRD